MLTYDIIIKHLMPPINTFSLQSNIVMKSNDFPFFSKLFDDTFYRFGINNNSLNNCINYCFNTDINDNIDDLDINIIIFDFKNNKIEAEYKQTKFDFFNPWKPTLLLAKYENWWEPIVCKDTKIFSFSSPKSHILKNNILNQPITKYNTTIDININDNFQEILDIEGFTKSHELSNNSSDIDEHSNDTFIKKDIQKETLTLAKLNKMKKEELEELCTKMNKVINKLKYTKKDLIDIIITI
jgi:hypothetical protein